MTAGPGGPLRHGWGVAGPDVASLHRSAVMLTGAADTGQQLVRVALRRAGRRGSRGGGRGDRSSALSVTSQRDLLAGVVREYLRRSSHVRTDRVNPVGGAGDAGDVLESLRPRQRAAAVLMLVEGWSVEETARVVGVSARRVSSLVPRTEGLADALRSVADHQSTWSDDVVPAEPVSSADLQNVVADGAARPPAEQRLGRRPLRAVPGTAGRLPGRGSPQVGRGTAVIMVVLGGVIAVAVLAGPQEGSPRLVTDGDGSGVVAGDLSGRGWVLGPGGDPPPFREGLRLIDVSLIDYARATEPLELDTLPRKGHAMYAALWCDMPPEGADLVPPTATLTLSGQTVAVPCAGKHDDPALRRLVPLPPPQGRGRVPVDLAWQGDLPGRGSAVLATYTEFGQNQPAPVEVAPWPPPAVPSHAAALDGGPPSLRMEGAAVFVQQLSVAHQTRLSLWSGGTGRFTILVNGVIVSDDGDLTPPGAAGGVQPDQVWQHQDPELRDGSWTIHAPGQTHQFTLPEALRPPSGGVRDVTVQVHVAPGVSGRWQLQVSHARPAEPEVAPIPYARTDAPPEIEDWQLAAAWQVPVTGHPYPLRTPPTVTPDTVFITVFPSHVPAPALSSLRGAVLHSELGSASSPWGVPFDHLPGLIESWPGWGEPASVAPPAKAGAAALGQVSISLLGPSAPDDQATVLAYDPAR